MGTMEVGQLLIKMAADTAQLRSDMALAQSTVGQAMDGITKTLEVAKKALVAFVGVASVDAFASMIKGSIAAADALGELSVKTGASVEALSGLAAVGKLTGTTGDQIADMMNKLAKNTAMASEEGKGAAQALRALNINFDDFQGLTPDEKLKTIADAMAQFGDGSGKSAAAMALLGKTGADALPYLRDLAAVGELQAKVTTEQAERARDFDLNLKKLQTTGDAWKKELAMGMLPALQETSKAVLEVFNGTGGLRAQVAALSKDGSIADWTRGAITGFTYLIDVGEVVWRLLKTIGEYIAYSAAMVGTQFGAMGQAADKLAHGDLAGAWEAIKGGARESINITQQFGQKVVDVFSEQTLGSKIRAASEAIREQGTALKEVKPQVDLQAAAVDKSSEAVDRAVAAGDKYLISLQSQLDAARMSADLGRALTKTEEEHIKLTKELTDGTYKMTAAKQAQAHALIDVIGETRDETEWIIKSAAENAKALDAQVKNTDKLREQVQAQDEHNVTIGLSKEALQAHEQALLDDAIAQKQRMAGLMDEVDADMARQYREQAAALQQLKASRQQAFDKQAAVDAANAWKATFDSISEGLFQAFSKGGKSGWEYVKHLVQDTVLRMTLLPVIQQTVGSIGNSILGTGSGQGGLSALGNLGSLFGAGGGSLLGAGSAFGSGLQLTLGGSGGTGLALDGAAAMLGEGQIGAGLMQGAGALGPYAAAAVAIYSLAKSLDKSGTPHMGSVVTANSLGAITGGADPTRILDHYNKDTDTALKSLLGGSVGTLNSLSTAFGGAADFSALGKFAADNTDSSFGGLQLNRGSSLIGQITRPGGDAAAYDKDPTKAFASYAADVAKQVRAAIDTINLPDWATKKLSALTESATIDDIAKVADEVVKTAAALEDFKANIRAMGVSFASLSQISDESLMALTNAAGGLDQLKSGLKTYYGVYFSDAEKAAMQTAAISDELKKYGIDVLPHTREEFRKLVEAQDLTTQSGIDAYAALLRVASAFDAVMNSGEAAAEASKKAADEAAKKARVDLNSQPISGGVDATGLKAMVDYEVQRQTLQANITPYIATLKSQLSTGQAVPEWIERYLTQPIGDLEARIESVAQVQLAQDMAYAERQKTADQNAQAYLQDIAQQLGNRPGGPNREELALQAQNKATLDLIASLDKVHDALVGYKDQLTFGKFSSLGVEGQYAESRKMLDSIFGQAMANDAVARSRFTSVADQFLGLSQQNFGSTGGFYTDKDYVLTLIDKLTNKIDQLHQTAVDGNVIAQAGAAATVDALQDNNAMAASVVGQAALQKARSV